MRALLSAARALRTHWRLFLFTYFLQFCVAGLAAFAVWLTTLSLAGGSPLLSRADDGDLPSLILLLKDTPALMIAPIAIGLAAMLAYMAMSWFMAAGLITVFRSTESGESLARFGAGGMRRFFAFARLTAWMLIPYGLIAIVLVLRLDGVGSELATALSESDIRAIFFWRLLPVLILLWLVWTLSDVARVQLVAQERASAWRSITAGSRAIVKKPALLAITLAGHLVSGLIVLVSFKLVGVGGGVAAFVARQLWLAARHSVHVGVIAAEVDRLKELEPRD